MEPLDYEATQPAVNRFAIDDAFNLASTAFALLAVFACNPSILVSVLSTLIALLCSIIAIIIRRKKAKKIGGFAIVNLVVALIFATALFLLPSLGRPRPAANRLKCESNLRALGRYIASYASNDPQNQMPPDLATLAAASVSDPDFVPYLFLEPQPNGRSEVPSTAPSSPPWPTQIVPGSKYCDYWYVYKPGRFDQLPATTVIMLEPLDAHENAGINVLYADGSTDWIDIANARMLYGKIFGGHNTP